MATYGTDLNLISDCYTGTVTVVEMGAPYADGNIGAIDAENFIEGGGCITQETKNAVDIGASVAFDNLSNITIAADEVVFMWMFFAVGADLYTYANNGHVMIIGSSTTAYDTFRVSGSDRTPNPYGGWYNYAVDPTLTPTTAYGGGSTAHRYFGSGVSLLAKISKGNPHAIDAIRYGRGEIYCTGTGCTFTGMAAENDDNTTNQNRWGLFQDVGGSYLWKGLMSFGQAATAATFSHTGATIAIDDMVHVYSYFNKIEFNHVDTDVTWVNITFNSLSTVSPGNLEMIADCTVDMTGCTFNDMGTFIFDSNADLTSSIWNSCGLVTTGASSFDLCSFNSTTDAVKAVIVTSPANAALITNCTFTSSGTGHGLEIGGTAADFTLTGCVFTGYDTADPGTAANKAIYVNIATGTVNLTVSGGSGVTLDQHVRTAGATVNVIAGAVTVYAKCVKTDGTALEDIRIYVAAKAKSSGTATTDTASKLVDTAATFQTDGIAIGDVAFNQTDGTSATVSAIDSQTALSLSSDNFPDGDEDYRVGGAFPDEDVVTIVNSGTTATVTHTGHGMSSNDYVYIEGGNQVGNEGIYQITFISSSSYSYTMLSSPSSPTGTITATFVALFDNSDASGEASTSRLYSVDQPVSGWARNTIGGAPYYQEGIITGTIDTADGLTATAVLVSDE